MKIELDIPIEEFNYTEYNDEYDYCTGNTDNHVNVLIEMITDKAAALIVEQIDYDKRLDLETTLENKINSVEKYLEDKITERVSKDSYKTIADNITDTVVNRLSEKYERSQQYRTIKNQFNIENDKDINNSMRTLISDIVRSEVKKIIKL